jgi:hemerythrin
MALLEWEQGFSVNVAEIDRQHQKLIGMINALNDAMREGKGKEVLARILGELSVYAGDHFAVEEKYFEKFGYPAATSHKLKHASYVKKVSEFKNGFDTGQLTLTVEVMSFLKNWWKDHIQKVDKEYSPFFATHGLR